MTVGHIELVISLLGLCLTGIGMLFRVLKTEIARGEEASLALRCKMQALAVEHAAHIARTEERLAAMDERIRLLVKTGSVR